MRKDNKFRIYSKLAQQLISKEKNLQFKHWQHVNVLNILFAIFDQIFR